MGQHLMLWELGLFAASFATAIGAAFLDRVRPNWALWQRLGLASLAAPLGWMAFQAVILPFILTDPEAHAGFVRQWPLYLREVVLTPASKLWICGALCSGFLAWRQSRTGDRPFANWIAELDLLHFSGLCAVAILLPLAMEYWIETGQISGVFAFFVLACAFFAGFIPAVVASLLLLRFTGASGLGRFGKPIIGVYALIIAWRGYSWHNLVADQVGASAVVAVEIAALSGVFAGWLAVRRAIEIASGAAAEQTSSGPDRNRRE
jgi:hypothetical protein